MELSKLSVSLAWLMGLVLALGLLQSSSAQNSWRDYLDAHNRARSQVGVGHLTWDPKLAAYAQNYVNSRAAGDCNLVHSRGPYGENLAKGSGQFNGVNAVSMWVREKPKYNYASNSCVGGECLHYTQVVWRDTQRLGCARVQCRDGWWFVSCNYDPPGNFKGRRPY